MLRMSDPPPRINSSTGSTEYSRLCQKSLSFQASSQMVRASRSPPRLCRLCFSAGAK